MATRSKTKRRETDRFCLEFSTLSLRILCLCLLGLVVSCGGGGGGSGPTTPPPPPTPSASFTANSTSFNTSQTLGEADVTQEFTVTNSGDASGTFSLTTAADWILLDSTSGTLAVGASQTITATLSCSVDETRTGTISLSGGSGGTVQITINHVCIAPPIEISLTFLTTVSDGKFQEDATGLFSFTISSPWDGQGAVTYTLTSDNDVTFDPDTGSVEPDETVTTDISRLCTHLGETLVTITIQINDVEEPFEWTTSCTGNVINRVVAEYFQGIRTAVVHHNADDETWTTDVQPSSYLVAPRRTFLSAHVEHVVSETPVVEFTLTPSTNPAVEVNPTTTVQSDTDDSVWITNFVLDLSSEEIDRTSGWTTSLSWNGVVSGSPVTFQFADLDLSAPAPDERIENIKLGVLDVEPFQIRFVPITTQDGTPEFDASTYLTHPSDLLPTSNWTQSVDESLEALADDVRLNDVLLLLAERWIRQSLNPVVFYHGIIELPADSLEPCGLSYVAGQAAVSNVPNTQCDEYTIAHELGHNLSLDHSPGCAAPDADPLFPYSDGRIGNEDGWVLSTQTYIEGETDHYDLMGYCNNIGPTFLARYHFAKAAQNADSRMNQAIGAIAAVKSDDQVSVVGKEQARSLVVTGKVDPYGNFELFSVSLSDLAPPLNENLVEAPYEFLVSDSATGKLLVAKRFYLQEVAHRDETHWYLSIPLPALPVLTDFSVRDKQGNLYLQEDLSEKLEFLTEHKIYMHADREP